MKSSELTKTAMLCALCAVLGFIESMLPPFIPVSGAKIGLANIAVLYALARMGTKQAFFVALVKILVICFWFSGLNALLYSLFGTIAAFFAMKILLKLKFSPVTAGVAGGVFHNIGQLIAATLLLGTHHVLYLAPYLMVMGCICGFATGIITKLSIKYIPDNF